MWIGCNGIPYKYYYKASAAVHAGGCKLSACGRLFFFLNSPRKTLFGLRMTT
ncbi:trans-sialidase, putative, partial [Trypanosoma cruzi]